MKKILLLVFIISLFAACAKKEPEMRGPFTEKQAQTILCADERAAVISKFFERGLPPEQRVARLSPECGTRRDGKPIREDKVLEGKTVNVLTGYEVKPPEYLVKELPQMMQNPVRFDVFAGQTYMEDDAWQQYFDNLIVTLRTAQTLWDARDLTTPKDRKDRIVKTKANLIVSLDRLNTLVAKPSGSYSLKDSMQGRGRVLLSTFAFMDEEFDSLLEAFSTGEGQEKRFVDATMAIAYMTNDAYFTFFREPPILFPDGKFAQNRGAVSPVTVLFMLVGVLVVFFGVFTLLNDEGERIENSFRQYLERSNAWADDFNRQFLTINVKYLVLGTVCAFALLGILMGYVIGGFIGILLFVVLTVVGFRMGVSMPAMVLNHMKQARGRKVNAQIMDALTLLSNSIKSGMDIVQGFEMVAKDAMPPISQEFGLVIKNYQLGTTFERALEGMEERVESRLLSYMIKAIVLQRQVGGNLTKIFERIVENIREESKLEEKLDSLTAQQKIQSVVVAVVPWIMVSIMFLSNPGPMVKFYSSPFGIFTVLFCIVWISIGLKVNSKLSKIEV